VFRMLMLVLATTAIGTLAAGPAQAALTLNGRIYFESDRDGDSEIYSMTSAGTNVKQLTSNPGRDGDPAVSPDGSKVAFTRGNSVYVKNADGTGPETRLTWSGANRNPTWSPDGKRIAFESFRSHHQNFEIYRMNVEGFDALDPQSWGLQRLTWNAAEDVDPAWSPDGTTIAFTSHRDGNIEIYTLNANFDLFDSSTWGPPTRLTDDPGVDWFPAWTADSSGLLFSTNRHGQFELYIMHRSGGGETRMTYTSNASETEPTAAPVCCSYTFARAYHAVTDPHRDREIYTRASMNTAVGEKRLTYSDGLDRLPFWAPGFLIPQPGWPHP
jgi:Tol biopolymer transport system component